MPINHLDCSSKCLRNFLYVGNEEAMYISGDPEIYGHYDLKKVESLFALFKSSNPDRALNIIEIVNGENALPLRKTLFFTLAAALKYENLTPQMRNKIYSTALSMFKTSEDLFVFIKFVSKLNKNKIPSGLQKIIKLYYSQKDPVVLSNEIVHNNGYFGWSHKDLIKLSHIKTDNEFLNLIIVHLLFGFEKSKELSKDNSEAQSVMENFYKLQKLVECKEESEAAKLLSELQLPITKIPSRFYNSPVVWEAVIPYLSLSDLLSLLPGFYKKGFLKQDSLIQKKIIETLKDKNKIKSSQIHPVELFIAMKNFENGGKPKHPVLLKYLNAKEETKKETNPEYIVKQIEAIEITRNPVIVGALYKAVMTSFENLQSTGKSILITIDSSPSMNESCLTSKNVTCLEAAAILTLSLLKVEKRLTVAYFDKSTIVPLPIEKSTPLNQFIKKLQECPESEYALTFTPIKWAMQNKKKFDVFINITNKINFSCPIELLKVNPTEVLKKYNQEMSHKARLISLFLASHNCCPGHHSFDAMDINGFDKHVPRIIEAFVKNLF